MKVMFDAEVKTVEKDYTTETDKQGEIVHFYENDTCLIYCKDDNMLYRVKMSKINVIDKKGILG